MIINDPHSFARPNDAVVKHLDLNINVDFAKKILSGSAVLTVELKNNSTQVILDTRGLEIEKVMLDNGSEAKFTLGEDVKFLGRALSITTEPTTKKLTVFYSTAPDAGALQWLGPAQTAGKKFPFLFTQSQAILARTWVPIQDSPGIRFTYTATVKVPAGLLALMSAENPQEKNADGSYHFNMPQPIPAYLLALSVGDLVFHSFDKRTGVYAEPVTIDKATYEFADLPKMVDAAEKLYGPYAWGQYDLIILPPSFPFGGMENPRLTFATPTILAGDRSLTSLVAHELAHSWSGNLVTNATWNDFWMNEGFTVYFENRIMEALYGKDFADMQRILEDAEMTIADIDYINVHGTSTPIGDPQEIKAIQTVFGEEAYRLNISSTKSMTGHLLGAAGAIEAIASIMAVTQDTIPPTINHFTDDPVFDTKLNLTFNKAQKRKVRAALSNTFGFGGHNASIIVKKYEA